MQEGSRRDRMVLGIRGQVSELERDRIVHRMVEARRNKARFGESFHHLRPICVLRWKRAETPDRKARFSRKLLISQESGIYS